MSKNENRSLKDKQDAKKAAVLGNAKQGSFPVTIVFGSVAIIVIMLVFFLGGISKAKGPQATSAKGVTSSNQPSPAKSGSESPANAPAEYAASDGQISYQANVFDDGKAHYYKYTTDDGLDIRYFVLKSSDGAVRAAFDACDVCWRAGKGYEQSGDFMVCNNCGRRFASVKVNEVEGGCNPAPLARKVDGGNIVIKVDDILKGRQYFDFGGRG